MKGGSADAPASGPRHDRASGRAFQPPAESDLPGGTGRQLEGDKPRHAGAMRIGGDAIEAADRLKGRGRLRSAWGAGPSSPSRQRLAARRSAADWRQEGVATRNGVMTGRNGVMKRVLLPRFAGNFSPTRTPAASDNLKAPGFLFIAQHVTQHIPANGGASLMEFGNGK